jgi:hypothetical protein
MDRAAKSAAKMKKELSLDDVQYKAVKAINEDFAGKQSKVWSDSTLSKEAKHRQLKNLHQGRQDAIDKVLNDEQKSKWASHRAEQSKKRQAKMARHRSERLGEMQKELSLSDDQTSKIKAIDQEFGAKFRALREDSTLAREDTHERVKQLRQEYRSKTKSVLTEEQFKKWEMQKAAERKRRKF